MPYKDGEARKAYHRQYSKDHPKTYDDVTTTRGTTRKKALPTHGLISKDVGSRTGVCKSCGEVSIYKQGPRWACANAVTSAVQRSNWLKKYGLTPEQYAEMLEACAGCCESCGLNFDTTGKWPCVDHDHDTGRVRGLLCNNCNVGIGNLGDSAEGVRMALKYLERTRT